MPSIGTVVRGSPSHAIHTQRRLSNGEAFRITIDTVLAGAARVSPTVSHSSSPAVGPLRMGGVGSVGSGVRGIATSAANNNTELKSTPIDYACESDDVRERDDGSAVPLTSAEILESPPVVNASFSEEQEVSFSQVGPLVRGSAAGPPVALVKKGHTEGTASVHQGAGISLPDLNGSPCRRRPSVVMAMERIHRGRPSTGSASHHNNIINKQSWLLPSSGGQMEVHNTAVPPLATPTRALRVRQSMRTSYDSRLAALEAAEEEQRTRLAAPYRRRLSSAAKAAAQRGDVENVDGCFPPESSVRRKRRESAMSSAFANPYNNSYYAYFQSEEGDAEARSRALGLPSRPRASSAGGHEGVGLPKPLESCGGSEGVVPEAPQDGEGVGSSSHRRNSHVGKRRMSMSLAEQREAAEHTSKMPQWRQAEVRHSRHLLTNLHPAAATIYVKYQKLHDRMVEEDKEFERCRKEFLNKDRIPRH